MDIVNNKNVAVYKTTDIAYPKIKPFHPSARYPEIAYSIVSNEINSVFEAVRHTLALLNMDKANYGKSSWNPFGDFIQPNNVVLIKPNLVTHFNWGYKYGLTDTQSLITHGSVIRAVIDYVVIALKGKGTIIIGDSPVQLSSWNALMEMIGYHEIKLFFETTFPQITFGECDFRLGNSKRNALGVIERSRITFDKDRFVETDLGQFSLHKPVTKQNTEYGVVDYSKKSLSQTHNLLNHKYLFPKSVIDADVVINIPKLKTHSKAGITCSLKNFVGINSLKDYLPHFSFGSPNNGGDEYPSKGALFKLINDVSHLEWELESGMLKGFYASVLKVLKLAYLLISNETKEIFNLNGGGWYGNDTLWRTILDINRAFFYVGNDFKLGSVNIKEKKYFSIVDGLIGGEKLSPLLPSPVKSGFIIAGVNPVAVDTVSVSLMGLDYQKIKQIMEAYSIEEYPLINYTADDIIIKSNLSINSLKEINSTSCIVNFEPSPGYKCHIEV